MIDSGVEPGPEFGDRIVAFYDFTQRGHRSARERRVRPRHARRRPHRRRRHAESEAIPRPRPESALDRAEGARRKRAGTTSDVISAIEYATANKDRLGIDIINLSLGHPIYEPAATDPLVQAVEAAARAGIHVVASAGNHGLNPETSEPGYAGIVSPANAPSAIAVGAETTVGHQRA